MSGGSDQDDSGAELRPSSSPNFARPLVSLTLPPGRTSLRGHHIQAWENTLPEIARFFGIVIRMYAEAGGPRHRPHFHAQYHERGGVYALDNVELIAGSLPRRQEWLVLAWAELRREELIKNWGLLRAGEPPLKIEPLR